MPQHSTMYGTFLNCDQLSLPSEGDKEGGVGIRNSKMPRSIVLDITLYFYAICPMALLKKQILTI